MRRVSPLLKRADRWLGIPVVAMLGARPRRARPTTIRRLGLFKSAAIGDTLLLSGVVHDTIAAGLDLVIVCGEDNALAFDLIAPDVRRVVVSPRRPLQAIRLVRRERLDALVDFGSWPRFDATVTALSGARFRLGFRTAGQYRHFGYDCVVTHRSDVHEVDNYRRLIAEVGVRSESPPVLQRPHDASPAALDRPFVVFHPWSGGDRGFMKEWPVDRWRELARSLRARPETRGMRVVITGGRSEEVPASALARQISEDGSPAESVAGRYALREVASLLGAARAVVTVNTGIMHLAAELGAPTIALDGVTSPSRWGPIGPRARSVTPDCEGCGFLNLGFDYAGHRADCMEHISVDRVEVALLQLLQTAPSPVLA